METVLFMLLTRKTLAPILVWYGSGVSRYILSNVSFSNPIS